MSLTRLLLISGIAASVLYLAMDLVAAFRLYPGYDYTSQQVSELSAIGVWRAAAGRLSLRIAAVLIGIFAVNGLLWGLVAPMHMRGTGFTGTDTLHIAFAASAVALMLAFMVFGAAALGRGFRLFTAVVVIAMLAAGAVVSTAIPAIAAGEPTPWMGLVERVSVFAPMVWMGVFAVVLMRERGMRVGS